MTNYLPAIDKAFVQIDRSNFVPEEIQQMSQLDRPLPIGYGQTISQPTTVRYMLEWLDAKEGQKILDVGSGSGWSTALLSNIVGKNGKIYSTEIVPDLLEFGKRNCERAGIDNAEFFLAGNIFGLPKYAPFDRIIVSASTNKIPEELLNQLAVGGKMVIPIKHDILEITKNSDENFNSIRHQGFVFVPLVRNV